MKQNLNKQTIVTSNTLNTPSAMFTRHHAWGMQEPLWEPARIMAPNQWEFQDDQCCPLTHYTSYAGVIRVGREVDPPKFKSVICRQERRDLCQNLVARWRNEAGLELVMLGQSVVILRALRPSAASQVHLRIIFPCELADASFLKPFFIIFGAQDMT